MIEILRKNIDAEIEMLREISSCLKKIDASSGPEKKLLIDAVSSLQSGIKMINTAIPDLLNASNAGNKLPIKNPATNLERVSFKKERFDLNVGVRTDDKEKFLREISISENLLRKMKKKPAEEQEVFEDFQAARGYIKFSNRLFFDLASSFIKKGYFKPLYDQLKKANIDILFESYIAMMFFSALISFFAGIFLTIFLIFFSVNFEYPFVYNFAGDYVIRILEVIWLPIILPAITFVFLYVYPSTERSSIAGRIESELPFAVIHMSAISGSGISPNEVFRIIGLSKEYPHLRREFRKVLNQTNIYGYDLVTALENVARSTPSQKLSELFNGISTTISSGGSLPEFFEKRAETLLVSYKLDRERFIKMAETFMDIYISVVIATPMILMLLLVMISISGFSTQLSPLFIGIVISLIVALINILFIGFLHVKQPAY